MKIELKGHLNTSMIAEVKNDIDVQLANVDAAEKIVIDCAKLDYISSSGLRVLLAIKKKHQNLEIVNVIPEVYNVFEMTGFVRIFDIKKALRKVSLDNCKLIGEGGNGAVYRINDEEIVKISKYPQGDEALIHESEKVKEAFLLGVPTVISFDAVDCGNGHKGIVMEALDSDSLGMYLSADPSRMLDVVPKYVELFRQTNAVKTDSDLFRNIKEWLRSHLYLPQRVINDEEAAVLSSILDEIPDDNHFVHFDGHVGNVLMYGPQEDRNLMLIDMGDTGTGHPVLEIAGWAFVMLEPDYAKGCTVAERLTCMSADLMHEFSRRVLSEMFHVTDQSELDNLVYNASLMGRVKAVFIGQRWAKALNDEKFYNYVIRLTQETISLAPQVKSAIRYFVSKFEAMRYTE